MYCTVYGQLMNYITPGTVVNEFYTVLAAADAPGNTPTLGATSEEILNLSYCVMAGHQHNVADAYMTDNDTGIKIGRDSSARSTMTRPSRR